TIKKPCSIEGQVPPFDEVLSKAPDKIVVSIETGDKEVDRDSRRPRCGMRVDRKPVRCSQQCAFGGDLSAQILPREYRKARQINIRSFPVADPCSPERRALANVIDEVAKLYFLPTLTG